MPRHRAAPIASGLILAVIKLGAVARATSIGVLLSATVPGRAGEPALVPGTIGSQTLINVQVVEVAAAVLMGAPALVGEGVLRRRAGVAAGFGGDG